MSRFVIEEDQATYLRNVYEVEAADEDEAHEKHEANQSRYLGFSVRDNVESVDAEIISVEQTDATPFMSHPEDEPDPADVAKLVEAAKAVCEWASHKAAWAGPCRDALEKALKPFLTV